MIGLVEQNKIVYNRIAKLFSATRQFLWDDLKPLVKYVKHGDRVLDLGCGSGRLYQLFSDLSIVYTGVDFSEAQISIAEQVYPKADFVVAEMEKLPFESNEFDAIYSIASFHHLPDEMSRLRALSEMYRVLKPGGKIVMTNWNLYSKSAQKTVAKGKWEENHGEFMVPWMNPKGEILGKRYYHGFVFKELEELFEQSGLVLLEQYYSTKGGVGTIDDSGNIVSILKKRN